MKMGALSSMQPVHRPLVFALNGERVELRDVDPATTVLHYIRSATRFKGPKRSCGEGTKLSLSLHFMIIKVPFAFGVHICYV